MTNTSNADYAALILRVSLGVLFIAHGALKLFVFTPAGTVGFFESLGLPAIFAYLTILAELGGGAALIAGFATRLVSIATLPILLGAVFMVHGANGWLYTNPNGGWEFPAFWAVTLVVQALLGDGAYALKTPRLLALQPATASE
ncbi:MAG: DoxX family protein [Nisaea sp.]|uniref:DoxX family protein n=1 Tax=Nisaea sp. TaxID=2024842 RepID=UPI001B199E9B|nr:DoxX family protein [Nisaea sp.]MBO6561071.1 DoxX family protein [Nisaea sp.]